MGAGLRSRWGLRLGWRMGEEARPGLGCGSGEELVVDMAVVRTALEGLSRGVSRGRLREEGRSGRVWRGGGLGLESVLDVFMALCGDELSGSLVLGSSEGVVVACSAVVAVGRTIRGFN